MVRHALERLGLALLACAAMASCGGGGGAAAPAAAPTLASVAVSPLAVTVNRASTQQLTVTGMLSDGTAKVLAATEEKFTSSDTTIATVDSAGLVTVMAAAAVGATVSISVTDIASGIVSASAAVITVGAPTLATITVSPATATLTPGAMQQLTLSATYSDGTISPLVASSVSFTSSNTAVATVSATGVVTAAAGASAAATATISASVAAVSGSTLITVAASATPQLASIALSPAAFSGAPGATQQLTVTGTYSDNSSKALAASGETFSSSNSASATVSAAGLITVPAGAVVGTTATISVTDAASGISVTAVHSTVVTVSTPSANSLSAAAATATNNPLCTAISPFYWEIGDVNGSLANASVGTSSAGPVVASTTLSIASASKMLYASYVVQVRGAAGSLSTSDINFLHFTSGYTNMGDTTTSATCPSTLSPDTVNQCLTLSNSSGDSYSAQDPSTIGVFDYDSGHMENHASQNTTLGNLAVTSLGPTVSAQLGTGVAFVYSEPLMSGGVMTNASTYALVLRHILNGSLAMHDALGTSPVCTVSSATCTAASTPFPQEAWHYSIGHWVEDNPATNGDGAFSSAGAFGFYPWIDKTKSYYGVISREQPFGAYPSAQCGRLIRRAFMTGAEQAGTLPTG